MEGSLKFHKAERLRHKRLVESLFSTGEGIYDYPLRLTWRLHSAQELEESFRTGRPEGIDVVQMMVTIPKRKRRRAVDRVLLRRRIREAYRLHRLPMKTMLQEDFPDSSLSLAFVYISDQNVQYSIIEKKVIRMLEKVSVSISKLQAKAGNPQA